MSLYTIIIPCHNDCKKANELSKKFSNVIIGHNGCNRKDSFNWSNKAKTINELVKKINSKYVVVLDADVKPADFALNAFEREMKKGVRFGTALQLFFNHKKELTEKSFRTVFNGCFWFIKTDLIKKIVVPENCVTEDTAYNEILKKKGIKAKMVSDAIVFVDFYEKTLDRKLRQIVRYELGALQLINLKVYQYSIYPLALFFGFWLIFIPMISLNTLPFILVVLFFELIFYFVFKNKILDFINKKKLQILFVAVFDFLVAPTYAVYLFLRRKEIW